MKNIKNSILEQLNTLETQGKKICVAFSGGSDSVCLLHSLLGISKEKGFELSAIHINHHLRGAESDGDADFAKEFCDKSSVPIKIVDVFVADEAEKRESTELAARRLRYRAFEDADADYIATAHNADDSLETFLINFSRGSGLKGLCGIPTVRQQYLRPLINCSKKDILQYCEMNGLQFVTDSSNLSDDYTRNKVRHHIIPEIEKVFPDVLSVSKRNFQLLKRDNDFLETVADTVYNKAFFDDKLKLSVIMNEHIAVASRVILKYCYQITNRNMDNMHLELLLDFCRAENGKTELFDGFYAYVKNGFISIEKNVEITFSTRTEVISAENFNKQLKINNLLLKNALDYDKIIGELKIRTRLAEDRLRPIGRGLSKPLRKLQSESKIEPSFRDNLPVAADDKGAVWSYLLGADERVAVDKNTKNVLIFKVYKRENRGQ